MSSSDEASQQSSESEASSDENNSSINIQQSPKSSSSSNSPASSKLNESARFTGKSFRNEIEINLDFQPLKRSQPLLTAEELESSDNEVWMVTLPNSMNAEDLCNIELSFSKSTQFKIGKEEFETIVRKKKETSMFVLPNSKGVIKMATKKSSGIINIVKDVKIPKENENALLQSKQITEIPQGLKRRHPIYGNDLEGMIHQSSLDLKRCKQEITTENNEESRKKEKKKKRNN